MGLRSRVRHLDDTGRVYLIRRGALPTFFELFPMYGGPWSARYSQGGFVWLLGGFMLLTLVAAWAAWLLWNGSKLGAVLSLALLPAEAVFWLGFALPIPWFLGIARAILIVLAWRSLGAA